MLPFMQKSKTDYLKKIVISLLKRMQKVTQNRTPHYFILEVFDIFFYKTIDFVEFLFE
jgi:hypothetical protein